MDATPDHALAEAMHTYVQETAPILALRLGADDCVVEANAEAHRLLRPGLTGKPFAELLVSFTRPANLREILRRPGAVQQLTLDTAAGLPETLEFRFFTLPDNGTIALGSPDFDEHRMLRQQVLGMNSELNDVTRQLHQANAQLRQLNQLKNQFLGMAAHDLRKPIGLIMTYNEFVLDEAGPQLAAEHREFLRTSTRAAHDMREIIDNYLDLAVIESGQLRLHLAQVSGAQLMAAAEPTARILADRKTITLLIEPVDPSLRCDADVGMIQQVLLNLIGNAIEHSQPGQRVWLSMTEHDQHLVVTVRDEGVGIAPSAQAQLFEPFGREGPAKTAGERSSGLGLTIARLVVEAHGGQLTVKSDRDQGASFSFSLPRRRRDQP